MDNSTCHIPETKVQHISYHIIIVCYIINQSIICVFSAHLIQPVYTQNCTRHIQPGTLLCRQS